MRCPACGSPATKQEVHKTMDLGGENHRVRKCLCGARWVTVEKLVRGSLTVTGDPPVTTRDPPVTAGNPPVTRGGVGGGLPSAPVLDLFPAGSGSLEASGSEVLRKSATPPLVFMEVWRETGGLGKRAAAMKAWAKNGRPTWELIGPRYREYMRSQRPVDGFVMDLSTWLNARGWEQEWPEAKNVRPGANGTRPAATQQRIDAALEWVASKAGGGS